MKTMEKILNYILAFFIILNCRSVFIRSGEINFNINNILIIVLLMNIFFEIVVTRRYQKEKKRNIQIFFFYIIYMGIFYMFNDILSLQNFINDYMIIFPLILIFLHIYNENNMLISFLKIFENVIVFIAGISIIMYLGCSIFKIIQPTGLFLLNWGELGNIKNYYYIYFETQKLNGITRNSAIFAEGPIYNLVLCIGLIIELFIQPKKSRKSFIILFISILSTLTTTGIIISLFSIFMYILVNKRTNLSLKIILFFFFCIFGIIIIQNVIEDKMQTSSYNIRGDDYISAFITWKKKPIFGTGLYDLNVIRDNMASYRKTGYQKGFSSSIMEVMAEGGIYLLSLYICPILKCLIIALKKKDYFLLIFTLLFAILAFNTTFPYTAIMFMFISLGLLKNRTMEEKTNE